MTKLKTTLLLLLATILLLFVSMGATLVTYADTDAPVQTEETDGIEDNVTEDESGFEKLVEQFTAYLKDKYGEDYEFYYNKIIEQWGSIEEYLLSLSDELPEEYQSAWSAFVGWLGEYSPIWATALAIIIIVIIAIVGKKQFNMTVDRIVNKKLTPIVNELNLQSNAMVSNLRALKSLLPNNEKYSETVKELEEAEKELKNG